MANNLFFEGLAKNGQVILNEMTSELILKSVGVITSPEGLHRGVLLDTETTGLETTSGHIKSSKETEKESLVVQFR